MSQQESPSSKRQRLSSPTYDDQCELPSQEELDAFEILNKMITDADDRHAFQTSFSRTPFRPGKLDLKRTHEEAFEEDSPQQPDPLSREGTPNAVDQSFSFAGPSAISSTPHKITGMGTMGEDVHSSSFDAYAEVDDSGFFENSMLAQQKVGFHSAATLHENASLLNDIEEDDRHPQSPTRSSAHTSGFKSALQIDEALATKPPYETGTSFGFTSARDLDAGSEAVSPPPPAFVGFASASKIKGSAADEDRPELDSSKSEPVALFRPASAVGSGAKSNRWMIPSAEALDAAARRVKQWEKEVDGDLQDQNRSPMPGPSKINVSAADEARPELGASKSEPAALFRPASAVGSGAKSNRWMIPSAEALAVAARRVMQWEIEVDGDLQDQNRSPMPGPSRIAPAITPARPALGTVENVSRGQFPESPTPAGRTFKTPMLPPKTPGFQPYKKPFKSPLAKSNVADTSSGALSRPPAYVPSHLSTSIAREGSPTPSPFATPGRPGAATYRQATPTSVNKRKFATPFLPGMGPGEAGRARLEQTSRNTKTSSTPSASSSAVSVTPQRIAPPSIPAKASLSGKRTLQTCGMRPQTYTAQEFDEMGIDIAELKQVTPTTALYYVFNPTDEKMSPLGKEEALKVLLEKGCTLATQKWVDNHWSLILWKLAGMAALDPAGESSAKTQRWCFEEVVRQLLYRYERELNGGKRPPLRLIATGDAPAKFPMTLCVSNIFWPEKTESQAAHTSNTDQKRRVVSTLPEIELTDGWYRLRAEIDPTLEKAIRRGVLRVGRKLWLATARLKRTGKDVEDVLEAYDSCKLRICGNSAHLAPWYEKLGWLERPHIATLDSLTVNGGLITVLNLIIIKQHPIGYIEMIEKDGKSWTDGPWDQREEDRRQDQWDTQREAHADKLRDAFGQRMQTYEGYIERLEDQAGPSFKPSVDDNPPAHLEGIFDEIEDDASKAASSFRELNKSEAGWMARHIKARCDKQRETIGEEISRELDELCPPRNIRSMRVLVVRDAQWYKKQPLRIAQITVWNVFNIQTRVDDSPGHFREGDQYLVTDLTPYQKTAWMGVEEGAEIYLTTRNETTWRRQPGSGTK